MSHTPLSCYCVEQADHTGKQVQSVSHPLHPLPARQTKAKPPANVFLPKDRISGTHQGFGFCEFLAEQDADYAVKILNQIKLYGKPIRASRASYDTKKVDIGANLFIGNLDENVDESQLYDTFQTFGNVSEQPQVCL